jgi:pimeloyl-ACP methyl ester carboxylesterase
LIHYTFEREGAASRLIHGDVRMPEGPQPRSAVVVLHGFKGFKDWGFFPSLAERLAAAGHAVVSFNFTGSGVTREAEVSDVEAFASNTFTRELEEVALVVGLVRDGVLLPRKPRRIGLLGHSRGGADAILYAAGVAEVDALVTWGALSSFDRWTDETRRDWRENGRLFVLNTRTGRQLPLDVALLDDFERNRERLDVARRATEVRAPWLIVHGIEDLTVGVEEARVLARAQPAAELLLIEGAGHTFEVSHPLDGRTSPQLEEALARTLRHFERHLLLPS